MGIQWFTAIAQILNFLILVAILKRFLYKPIVRAMEQREQTIRERLQTAAQERAAAQQAKMQYEQLQQQLAAQQETLLQQAKVEVDQLRSKLIQNAHETVAASRRRWQTALQRQQAGFLQELRHRALQQVHQTLRQVLREMADAELEYQVIQVFLKRLQDLSPAERQIFEAAMREAQRETQPVTVYSTFELPETARQQIIRAVHTHIRDAAPLQFATTPHVISGIELRTTDFKLAWSLENYLDSLEETLAAVFAEETEAPHELR